VVAMMTLWNKVSSASPYLDDVRSGISEGPVRVCFVIFADLLQILAFDVLIRGSSWLGFDAAILTSSFGPHYNNVQHLEFSVLMVKNCKHVFFGGFLRPMFYQWIPNLVVRGEWLLQSSKPCLARVFACVPFLYCLFNAISKLRQTVNVRRNKMTDLVFDVLFFLRGRFFVLSSVFCTCLCFPSFIYKNMEHSFECHYKKN